MDKYDVQAKMMSKLASIDKVKSDKLSSNISIKEKLSKISSIYQLLFNDSLTTVTCSYTQALDMYITSTLLCYVADLPTLLESLGYEYSSLYAALLADIEKLDEKYSIYEYDAKLQDLKGRIIADVVKLSTTSHSLILSEDEEYDMLCVNMLHHYKEIVMKCMYVAILHNKNLELELLLRPTKHYSRYLSTYL